MCQRYFPIFPIGYIGVEAVHYSQSVPFEKGIQDETKTTMAQRENPCHFCFPRSRPLSTISSGIFAMRIYIYICTMDLRGEGSEEGGGRKRRSFAFHSTNWKRCACPLDKSARVVWNFILPFSMKSLSLSLPLLLSLSLSPIRPIGWMPELWRN